MARNFFATASPPRAARKGVAAQVKPPPWRRNDGSHGVGTSSQIQTAQLDIQVGLTCVHTPSETPHCQGGTCAVSS